MLKLLPNWPILDQIPDHLKNSMTNCAVYKHNGSTEIIFTATDGKTNEQKDCYRISQRIEGCSTIKALRGKNVIQVTARSNVILIATEEELFAMGNNRYGQIGNGEKTDSTIEQPFPVFQAPVRQFDIGNHHCVCLTADGDIFTWGSNTTGQLPFPEDSYRPKKVNIEQESSSGGEEAGYKFAQVTAWNNATFALRSDGRLYAWGANTCHTIVIDAPSVQTYSIPKPVSSFENSVIKKVVCAEDRVFVISEFGSLYAWGKNSSGELGLGHTSLVSRPVHVASFDDNYSRVIDVSVAQDFTLAKTSNGICRWGKFSVAEGHIFTPTSQQSNSIKSVEMRSPCYAATTLAAVFVAETDTTPGLISAKDFTQGSGIFEKSLNDETSSDFCIKVDGQPIFVHKTVLKLRSSYFRAMFSSNWVESESNELSIDHTPFSVYFAFLHYLYTDNLPGDLSVEDAFSLINLASTYLEEKLNLLLCDYILERSLNMNRVLQTYSQSIYHKSHYISGRCLTFVLEHLPELVKSEQFACLDAAHAKKILLEAAKADLFVRTKCIPAKKRKTTY